MSRKQPIFKKKNIITTAIILVMFVVGFMVQRTQPTDVSSGRVAISLGSVVETAHASYMLSEDLPDITFNTKDKKHTLRFALQAAERSRGEMLDDSTVLYRNVMPATDVEYEAYTDKVKETVILKQPGHPNSFTYTLNTDDVIFEKKPDGSLVAYERSENNTTFTKPIFRIPAPFMIDAAGNNSGAAAVQTELREDGTLVLTPDPAWLETAQYPIRLDPTVEIVVLTVHAHPAQGEDWVVDFTTQGTADLYIIPDDQATIDDDEFVSLSCDGEERAPVILAGDIVFYENWQCEGIGTVVHNTLVEGKHTLRFEFGSATAYAYNSTITETGSNTSSGSSSSPSITHGLTINEDDVIVAVIHINDANRDIVDNNGANAFTEAFEEQNGTETSRYAIFYRVAGASEPSSYTWSLSGTEQYVILLRVFSGVDTANVWDVSPSASTRSNSASGATATAPSMTTSNDGALGMLVFVSDSSETWSTPTNGYGTEVENSFRSTASYIRTWSTAGSTGTASATMSGSNDWTAHQIALKPAPPVNAYPTISSVSDTPDPVNIDDLITFSIDWNDTDAGDQTRSFVCKTDAFASSTLSCSGGYWTSSTSFATTDPATANYTAQSGDVGSNNYYAFVCDDDNYCSNSSSGTFTVSNNHTPTITSVTDAPDPVAAGKDIYWSVDWNDTDVSEMIKVQVCTTNAISSGTCSVGTWCSSPVFTNRDPEGLCTYTTQVGDIGSNNYYAFVCDDGGSCSTSSSGSFTVEEQTPTAPTALLVENMPNPVNIATTTPRFSSIFNDPNTGDIANKYCIEVNTQSDFAGTSMWVSDSDSCNTGTSMTNCSQGDRCQNIYYDGSALSFNANVYYWRMWYWDDSGNISATSTVANFITAQGTAGGESRGVRLQGHDLKGGVRLK